MWVAGASGFEVSGLVLEHPARRCFRGRDLDLFPTVFAMFTVVGPTVVHRYSDQNPKGKLAGQFKSYGRKLGQESKQQRSDGLCVLDRHCG